MPLISHLFSCVTTTQRSMAYLNGGLRSQSSNRKGSLPEDGVRYLSATPGLGKAEGLGSTSRYDQKVVHT